VPRGCASSESPALRPSCTLSTAGSSTRGVWSTDPWSIEEAWLTMDPWSTAGPSAPMDPGTWSTTDSAPPRAACDPVPVGPWSTVVPGSALGALMRSCSWEIAGTTAPGPSVASERPVVVSGSTWPAGCSTHPAEGAGDPISGSGSTWTIPFWISSGPRCSSEFGLSPIPECALPPPADSSGPRRPLGSSLGRSALSRSASAPACRLAPGSGENHPISVPSRCGGRGSSPTDPSAVVGDAVRGELDAPASPGPRSAVELCSGGPDASWPRSPRSTWKAACAEGSVTCEPLRPRVAISRGSGRLSAGVSEAPTESLLHGLGTAVRPTVDSDSPESGEAPVEGTVDAGQSVAGDGGAKALGGDEGELRPSAAGSGGGSGCLVGDPEASASWSVFISMCHRTASGGSVPQIGSSRASAGSCLGAVSRNGHSRDWFTVGVSPSCDGPVSAPRPLFSPTGDASAMPAPPAVPVGGDADRTDLPCSRTPSLALSSVLRRRRSPSAASSLLRNPPVRSSWTCGASSGRRLMAPASLPNSYEAACGTRERWSSTPDA
jgi:hypothetical protein